MIEAMYDAERCTNSCATREQTAGECDHCGTTHKELTLIQRPGLWPIGKRLCDRCWGWLLITDKLPEVSAAKDKCES